MQTYISLFRLQHSSAAIANRDGNPYDGRPKISSRSSSAFSCARSCDSSNAFLQTSSQTLPKPWLLKSNLPRFLPRERLSRPFILLPFPISQLFHFHFHFPTFPNNFLP
ncbi:hypothetical protein KP509_05G014200 [Ceratopteris richardii]|uniref:Uncharacterized protein n=1 Tax=Ceratopteris richardii TaxID=49495 RepID=A0A8T2UNJ9_CERRI|nr:hypothetical protein KP509_05G014200 [Ceratopteris richardii]